MLAPAAVVLAFSLEAEAPSRIVAYLSVWRALSEGRPTSFRLAQDSSQRVKQTPFFADASQPRARIAEDPRPLFASLSRRHGLRRHVREGQLALSTEPPPYCLSIITRPHRLRSLYYECYGILVARCSGRNAIRFPYLSLVIVLLQQRVIHTTSLAGVLRPWTRAGSETVAMSFSLRLARFPDARR